MTNYKQISSHLDVTPQQIGAAHKVLHKDGNFYQVESATTTDQYDVRYSREHGYTCTCKSGQHGFSNVRHASGVCWHVRAAIACQMEEEIAMREQISLNQEQAPQAPVLLVDGKAADAATMKRVFSSSGQRTRKGASLPQSSKFEMMKK